MNWIQKITLATLMSLNLTGCVALVAAGAAGGGVYYLSGQLKAPVNASIKKTADAATDAIADLQFRKISEATDALNSHIIARTAADEKVDIKIEYQTDESSMITIRFGLLGDQQRSAKVLEAIQENLD